MASGITLSAGVRQNLLSLQNTASMMASTQNRLATGKKVNSALDNPSNFFTSQTLADRAGDLNGLLDSIGQATKTLDAANNGITSLTKLVQSAKSIAQQARSATGAVETFSAISASSNMLGTNNLNGAESVATSTGVNTALAKNLLEAGPISFEGADLTLVAEGTPTNTTSANTGTGRLDAQAVALSGATLTETLGSKTATTAKTTANIAASTANNGGTTAGTVNITVKSRNGTNATFAVSLGADVTQAAVKGKFDATTATVNGAAGTRLDALLDVSFVADKLTITAKDSSTDFQIESSTGSPASSAQTMADIGLAPADTGTWVNSTSVFDQLLGNDSAAQGKTLTIGGKDSNGVAFADQTITFGTGAGQVNTLADFTTKMGDAQAASSGAFTASITAGKITIGKAAGKQTEITVGGTIAVGTGTAANATLLEGATAGTVFGTKHSQSTLADVGKALAGASGGPVDLSGSANKLTISINGTDTSVDIAGGDRVDDVIAKLSANTTLSKSLTFTKTNDGTGDHIKIDAKDVSADFTVKANGTSAALGLTTNTTTDTAKVNTTSLFNQMKAAGAVDGDTMTLSGTNGDGSTFTSSTITFGNGAGKVKSLAQLNTALNKAATDAGGAFSAGVVGGKITVTKPAGAKSSVTIGGTVGTTATAKTFLQGAAATPATTVFGTHNSSQTLGDIGVAKGNADLANGGTLSFTVNNKNYTVGLSGNDHIDDVVSKLSSSSLASSLNFEKSTDASGHDHIKIGAKDASVDFTINANTTSEAMGLTASSTASTSGNSTSLLDLLDTSFGAAGLAQGKTLTVQANGGKEQTITFGTGSNQVKTLADLNSKLGELSGVTATVSDTGSLDISVASGDKATSLKIGGTAAPKLGVESGTQEGEVITTTSSQTRANLQSDFNNVLDQIDTLTKDASYNGINLLNGDDLKVTFNENGSSSLTIKGVTFDSNNLGMMSVKGDTFQDNSQIDARISAIDGALSDLRSQGSKFGSNLSTVQTRQEFTKNMINTLQTGSDALVLADTNEEGANLLALQTRQQLSTTALSMSSQQDQAVLRLF